MKDLKEITAKTTSFITENTKQASFIALGAASLIFLFRKEIKQQLRRKQEKGQKKATIKY